MNYPAGLKAPDYLIFGHITQDLIEGGSRLGGTAAYSSILARRLGLDVVLVTSFAADLDLDILDGIQIINQAGQGTTTFKNIYNKSGRTQYLLDRAEVLDITNLPEVFKKATIVHLAPVAGEIKINAGRKFPKSEVIYSLQGWLRDWDLTGLVHSAPLPNLDGENQLEGTAFLSIEDLDFDRSKVDQVLKSFPDLVLTIGEGGAELYNNGQMQLAPAAPIQEVDPTGAGDIFAAAYIISKVMLGKSPLEAARFANALAGLSISRSGCEGIPTVEQITEVQKVY